MIKSKEAIEKIEKEFPELSDELHDEINDGLLHLQISEFSHLTQKAIDNGNEIIFKKVCSMFCELFTAGEPELVNALNVSFLEHLNFKNGKKNRNWAYKAMPQLMRIAFDEMEKYNEKLHSRG